MNALLVVHLDEVGEVVDSCGVDEGDFAHAYDLYAWHVACFEG